MPNMLFNGFAKKAAPDLLFSGPLLVFLAPSLLPSATIAAALCPFSHTEGGFGPAPDLSSLASLPVIGSGGSHWLLSQSMGRKSWGSRAHHWNKMGIRYWGGGGRKVILEPKHFKNRMKSTDWKISGGTPPYLFHVTMPNSAMCRAFLCWQWVTSHFQVANVALNCLEMTFSSQKVLNIL